MKRTAAWLGVLAAGLGMMALSHYGLSSAGPATATTTSAPATTAPTTSPAAAAIVPPGAFFLYLAGQALLLLGGSATLVRLYGHLLARKKAWAFDSPLVAIDRHRQLLIGLHWAYFGAVIVFAAIIYASPDVQASLLKSVGQSIRGGQGPLGIAGKAYLSKNIALAAAVTLGINFLLGSVLSITLPSAIVPGVGLVVAGFRAVLWGLILAPTRVELARRMLPHSLTLLLEGEAYILASFFALLIPIYLFSPRHGPTAARRYGRALMLNLRGNLLVLLILAAAAVYEAIEVIAMLP